jgi:hypothetical protein
VPDTSPAPFGHPGLPFHAQQAGVQVFTPPFPAVPGRAIAGGSAPGAPGAIGGVVYPPEPPPVVVLQQVAGASTYDYGLSSIEVATRSGSALVVLAGWDLSTSPTTAPMPAAYVTDSAGNLWHHITTTTSGVAGSRCCAWVCLNAMPIEWASVSLTTFGSSLAWLFVELAGGVLPECFSLDAVQASAASSAVSLAISPGVTSAAGFSFALLAAGATPPAPEVTSGVTWTALDTVTAGGAGPNPAAIFPCYAQTAAGTTLATTWTAAQDAALSGIVFAIRPGVAPAQYNPNFPVIRVEAGFGTVPGDPSQPPPDWTDITNRVFAPAGGTWFKTQAGRPWELATPEAGTISLNVDNHDGAFTPGNTASPYYPGVVLETPLRISAFWAGRWYALAYGWVERWPQEWPDLPQWGLSRVVATDAISVLAAVTMTDALTADALLDAPYALLTASEQYLSFSNGISSGGTLGTYTAADAQGLLAQNFSRTNQRTAMYADGNGGVIAETGQTTNLLGSAATGFGTSAYSSAPTGPVSGPGLLYTDPAMPSPQSGDGVTVSFWVIIPAAVAEASLQPVVFSAWGPPSSYRTASPSLQVLVENAASANTLKVTLADGSSITAPFSPSASPQQITLAITATSLAVYVNGAQEATAGLLADKTSVWYAVALGCPNYAYGTASNSAGNFTAFGLAIYACQLPVQRIVSNYATGITGQQGCDGTARIAQIMSWANLGLPRAGRMTFSGVTDGVQQGPAYSLAGTTASAACAQAALNDLALLAAWPTGAAVWAGRWALFNQAPVAAFGDSPGPGTGQVPYLQSQTWGYDNTYLYNTVSVTQQYGQNNLFTLTGTDPVSQAAYYARTSLAQTITTTSDEDVYTMVNWELAKYSQPSLRVSGVTVDAASNPAVAFPVVLALLQGQVVSVTRMPVGGAVISGNVLVQQVSHQAGPGLWKAAYQLSPYTVEAAVLQLDDPADSTVGNAALA